MERLCCILHHGWERSLLLFQWHIDITGLRIHSFIWKKLVLSTLLLVHVQLQSTNTHDLSFRVGQNLKRKPKGP